MNKLLKNIDNVRAGFFKKIPFKPKELLITSGVINMRNLYRPLFSTLIVLSLGAPALAATPITLEDNTEATKVEKVVDKKTEPTKEPVKVEEKKSEIKAAKKVAKKPRFETLPNGQKVKVFSGPITEMPKEVGVQYVTEDGYKKLLKELKEPKVVVKPTNTPVPMETKVIPVKATPVPATPITVAPVMEEKKQEVVEQKAAPIIQEKVKSPEVVKAPEITKPAPAAQALPIAEPATPITLQPIVQDPAVEVKPIDISTLPPASTPVKAQEVADPVPMIQQHPAPIVQAPVIAPATPVAPVAATPIVVAPVVEEKKSVAEINSVPKVTISVEQRAEMKKQLTEEFSKISIDDANANLSQKVLEEQQKVEDAIQAKAKADAEAKAKAEAEAQAIQAAKDEKEYRENAPLAEDNNATPAKAYTEEELKPVRLDKKNKNIVIELPKQRLNAYLTGAPMPKVENLEQQQLDEQRRGLRLEENSDMEEVEGPNYGNISN